MAAILSWPQCVIHIQHTTYYSYAVNTSTGYRISTDRGLTKYIQCMHQWKVACFVKVAAYRLSSASAFLNMYGYHMSPACMEMSQLWGSYQIRNIAGCACAGNAGNVFPRRRLLRKPLVSDPDMHHDTCLTHVPWCMSGSLAAVGRENVSGIPGACAPANFRIWPEAHSMWNIGCVRIDWKGREFQPYAIFSKNTISWMMLI